MTTICPNCHLPGTHANGDVCAGAQAEATLALLQNCGDKGICSGCSAEIYWMKHRKTGRPTPYTPAGLNHHIDCIKAADFKRAR